MSDREDDNADTTQVKPDGEHINIKVVDAEGAETFFKIKMSTKLGKLMNAYAERSGKDPAAVRFAYEGVRIGKDDTPKTHDMEDNDTIEVHIEQVGGK